MVFPLLGCAVYVGSCILTDKFSPYFATCSNATTNIHNITTQKSKDFIYTVAEKGEVSSHFVFLSILILFYVFV